MTENRALKDREKRTLMTENRALNDRRKRTLTIERRALATQVEWKQRTN